MFIAIVWPAFLARVKPVSAMANPACMNMTKKPHTSVQTMLMAIRLCPMTSASLAASGSLVARLASSSLVGAADVAPITSAAPPMDAPEGSGSTAWHARGKIVPSSKKNSKTSDIFFMIGFSRSFLNVNWSVLTEPRGPFHPF
jgi:hypothetical protein